MNAPVRPAAATRWDAIDVARGVAIVAMAVYHFAWDLSFLRLIATDTITDPAWRWFARSIAGSFLFLVGIGLALAHGERLHRGAFLRRLAKIGGAALTVTLATLAAFPDSFIFFGILHCIAASSVLALPFLRAPPLLVVAAAALSLAAPRVLTSPALDHPLLDWLGLGSADPVTNDYVPIFPWFGIVLLGTLAGRALRRRPGAAARWQAHGPIGRALARAGRWSLPIYLVHQPILLGLLYGLLQLTGPNPAAESAAFGRQCTASCIEARRDEPLCRTACACMIDRLKEERLFEPMLRNRVHPDDQPRVTGLARQCFAAPRAP